MRIFHRAPTPPPPLAITLREFAGARANDPRVSQIDFALLERKCRSLAATYDSAHATSISRAVTTAMGFAAEGRHQGFTNALLGAAASLIKR